MTQSIAHFRGGRQPRHETLVLTEERFRVGRARRCLDVVVSSVGLIVATPLIAMAAALVLFTDGRPVFFKQSRIGEHARPFTMYKLRSMRISDAGSGSGPGVTTSADPRVTRVGRVLRRLSIDELPQLWHVFRGQMTLVGPRPESVSLAAGYPRSSKFVLLCRPGLTGPAQLTYREASATPPPSWPDADSWYLTVIVPLRTEADLGYLIRPTFWQTLRWLAATALHVVGHSKAQH
jgi:lipopolysaccharide/colanic/teichoic acid biosynthesis glycosyltransferase